MAADLEIGVSINARGTKAGGAEARREIKSVGDEAERTSRRTRKSTNAASQDYQRFANQVKPAAQQSAAAIKQVDTAAVSSAASMSRASAAGGAARAAFAALGAGATALIGVFAAVVVGIGALILVAVVLWKKALDISKAFADMVLEQNKWAEANGVSINTASALNHELEAQGRSLSELEPQMRSFRKTIGEAAAGSEEARAKLKLLGIDGSKAIHDVDKAFKQAIKSISAAPNAAEQIRLAYAAFGEQGYKLLPIIREFGGDLDKVIKKADELGIVLGGRDVEAAKTFNRAYAEMQSVFKALGLTFVREFLPTVIRVLKEFNLWLSSNKIEILAWATWAGDKITWVIDKLAWAVGKLAEFKRQGDAMAADIIEQSRQQQAIEGGYQYTPKRDYSGVPLTLPVQPQTFGMQPQVIPQMPDLAVLESARAEMERKMQEIRNLQKRDVGALIQIWENYGTSASTTLRDTFAKLKDEFAKNGNAQWFTANTQQAVNDYVAQVKQAYDALKSLEDTRAAEQNLTENEKKLLQQAQLERLKTFQKLQDDVLTEGAKLVSETQKKAADEDLKNYEAAMQRRIEITEAVNGILIAKAQQKHLQGTQTEMQTINAVNALELASLQKRKAELDLYLQKVTGNAEKEKEVRQALALLNTQITQQEITNANRVTEAEKRKGEELERLTRQYEDYRDSLGDEIDLLQRGGRELSVYEKVQRDITRNYKDMDPERQKALLAQAAEIDVLREAQRQYDEFRNTILDGLDALEGGWGNFFKWMGNRFKEMLKQMVADWLTSKFFQLFFKGGNQQIAGQNGSGGGLLGSILGIFGRGAGGGIGPGGTAVFNPAGGGGSGGPFDFLNTGNLPGAPGSPSTQGGGGFGGLAGLFGKGGRTQIAGLLPFLGGSLGKKFGGGLGLVGGALLGTTGFAALGGFGALASTGAISGTTALGLTALLTNPFTIAAGVGLLVGGILLSRNKRRRKEEQQRNAAMLSAFDALKQYDSLIADVRGLRLDGASGIAQGEQLGQQVRASYLEFANSLKDKKTKRIAIADVHRIDAIITTKMAELRAVADVANAAGERNRRLLPEFAGGAYISSAFRRYNGMIGGQWNGRDVLPAMLAHREMVLNPMQQSRVISQAGFDVFKTAAIPGYAGGAFVNQPSPVTVNSGNMAVTVVVQQDEFGRWQAHAQSDAGQRVTAKVVEKKYSNDEIKLTRR